MLIAVGDKISINSGEISGIVVDIAPCPKTAGLQGIDTNWIWIEYKLNGRKKRTRIPECNLEQFYPIITRS